MDEKFLKDLAQQLRKPEGDLGKKVGENMNVSNALMNTYTFELLKPATDDVILEIGMGNGYFVKDILTNDTSITYFGCDYSELMVNEASQLNQSFIENGQAKFMVASADQLPFNARSFDKIFTINTIYFWANPSTELTELHRVLKPKGKFYLTVRSQSTMEKIPVTQFGFKIYSKELLIDLLKTTGFNVLQLVEKQEPDMEFSGNTVKVSTWILEAEKI